MKKVILLAVVALFGVKGFSQQDPQFTQYMFDKQSFNPGVTGLDGMYCLTGLYRTQWTGFDGAPKTMLVNYSMPLLSDHGLGMSIIGIDGLGQQRSTYLRASYAYHYKMGVSGTLSTGAAIGFANSALKSGWAAFNKSGEFGTGAGDNAIPAGGNSQTVFDLAFGVYYTMQGLYLGISATHLTQPDLENVSIKMIRHLYFTAGYDYPISGNTDLVLQPSVLYKTDGAANQVDLNCNLLINQQFWGGVSYRNRDAIAPQFGYRHVISPDSELKVGYSYDMTTSELKNYSNGSHEIMFKYCWRPLIVPPNQKHKDARFL